MYDRPTAAELIEAARQHLESALVPVVRGDPKLYFQTLVAVNVLRIVERELALAEPHLLAEWESLNALDGTDQPAPPRQSALMDALAERNRALCERIRQGAHDGDDGALFAHVVRVTQAQLTVANPRFLQTLAQERDA